jgi:hypothetical protein
MTIPKTNSINISYKTRKEGDRKNNERKIYEGK